MSGDSATKRIHDDPRSTGVDGVRGFAALTVFVYHVWLYGRQFTPAREPFDDEAKVMFQFRLGLICFFVLTGYLLFRSFLKSARAQKRPVDIALYAKRRAARILPAYWVCLIGTWFMLNGAEGKVPGVKVPEQGDLWLYFLLAQNYDKATILGLNPVTWTLVVELAFYVLLPFLGLCAFYLARGRYRWLVGLCVGMIAAGMLWHWWVFEETKDQLWSKTLPHYLPYFAVGMLAALFVQFRTERAKSLLSSGGTWTCMLIAAAAIGAAGYYNATSPSPLYGETVAIVHDLPSASAFALLIVVAATGTGAAVFWIRSWPLATLGIVSYGFYLWHVPVILYLRRIGYSETEFIPLFALAFPVTLALATASFHLVEKPLIARYHRRKLNDPDDPPAVGEPPEVPAREPVRAAP